MQTNKLCMCSAGELFLHPGKEEEIARELNFIFQLKLKVKVTFHAECCLLKNRLIGC